MPCNDITEVIRLHIDADDKIYDYTLNKRTCGAEIGQASLLKDFFGRYALNDISTLDDASMVEQYADVMLESDEFLYFKHFFAVQEAVRVLLGESAGAAGDACAASTIIAENDGLTFEGMISVDAVTEKIKSCGNCGQCGSRKRALNNKGLDQT